MGRRFESEPAPRIQQQPTRLENMVTIPSFGAIKEDIPLHADEWNVQRVEKGDCREVPLEIRIHQRKIRTDRAMAVVSFLCCGMPAQYVHRISVETQKEVIFDGQAATRCPCLDCPIQI